MTRAQGCTVLGGDAGTIDLMVFRDYSIMNDVKDFRPRSDCDLMVMMEKGELKVFIPTIVPLTFFRLTFSSVRTEGL